MKVYAGMDPAIALRDVGAFAARIESLGYDGLHVAETVHDSMSVALLALEHTTSLTVRTAITLAFVRSPTLLAYQAWDLQSFSNGRFELGLGTQVRENIVDRFAMAFDPPLARMADYIDALRALFSSFDSGQPLEHHGPYYHLTRLQPYFNPGPLDGVPMPSISVGGVGAGACRLAGSLADGFISHPTNSNPRYFESICLPNLRAGMEAAGRSRHDLSITVGTQVITGADERRLQAERERQRTLLAFLYSTPAYRPTLDLYGVGDIGNSLRRLIAADRWSDLAEVLPDELMAMLIPTGSLEEITDMLLAQYASLADGIVLSVPVDPDLDPALAIAIARLQAA